MAERNEATTALHLKLEASRKRAEADERAIEKAAYWLAECSHGCACQDRALDALVVRQAKLALTTEEGK